MLPLFRAFIQSGELKTHMVSHTTEKIYLCSYCGSKFARKLSLKVHVRRIHSIKSEAFICHLCGKGFKGMCFKTLIMNFIPYNQGVI